MILLCMISSRSLEETFCIFEISVHGCKLFVLRGHMEDVYYVIFCRYCEERPLLLSNIGMGARLCTYYQKSAPDDQTASLLRSTNSNLGHVISLNPADKSPFVGDIKAGCSQFSIETNMYRAPIFSHKVSSTDYLLVRTAKGKLSIRRIDRLDVVGQQVCRATGFS